MLKFFCIRIITFCPKNSLPCVKYGPVPCTSHLPLRMPCRRIHRPGHVGGFSRQIRCTASQPRFLDSQHCLQPLFLRCSRYSCGAAVNINLSREMSARILIGLRAGRPYYWGSTSSTLCPGRLWGAPSFLSSG